MSIRCPAPQGKVRTVRPTGELDLSTAPALRDLLRGDEAAPAARLIADLTAVTLLPHPQDRPYAGLAPCTVPGPTPRDGAMSLPDAWQEAGRGRGRNPRDRAEEAELLGGLQHFLQYRSGAVAGLPAGVRPAYARPVCRVSPELPGRPVVQGL